MLAAEEGNGDAAVSERCCPPLLVVLFGGKTGVRECDLSDLGRGGPGLIRRLCFRLVTLMS